MPNNPSQDIAVKQAIDDLARLRQSVNAGQATEEDVNRWFSTHQSVLPDIEAAAKQAGDTLLSKEDADRTGTALPRTVDVAEAKKIAEAISGDGDPNFTAFATADDLKSDLMNGVAKFKKGVGTQLGAADATGNQAIIQGQVSGAQQTKAGSEVVAGSKSANIQTAGAALGPLSPPLLQDLMGGQTGGKPTPDQDAAMVKAVQESGFPDSDKVHDQTSLYDYLKQHPSAPVKALVTNALFPEARVSHTFTVGANKQYSVTDEQLKAASPFTADSNTIAKMAQTAYAYGLVDKTGDPLWQPVLALAKYYGLTAQEAAAQKSAAIDEVKGNYDQRNSDYQEKNGNKVATESPDANQRGTDNVYDAHASFSNAVVQFKNGLAQYNDATLAYVSTFDPALALRLSAATKKAPPSLADQNAAAQLLVKGGWDQTAMAGMGYGVATGLSDLLGGMSTNSAANQAHSRTMVDPAAVEKDVRSLWRSWFHMEPSTQELGSFTQQIQGLFDQASAKADEAQAAGNGSTFTQQIDEQSNLEQFARGTPEYQQLYGKKSPGLTEEQYGGQFQGAAQDMLGNQAPDDQAIQAGMQTGDPETTTRSIFGNKKSYDNSTFMGRIAQAAQIVSQNT